MMPSNVLFCPQLKDSSNSYVYCHIREEKLGNIHLQADLEKLLKLMNQLLKQLMNYLRVHNQLQFYK